MVVNETTQMLNGVVSNLFSGSLEQITPKVLTLLTIFQAIGGAVLVYIIFNIISLFWTKKKTKEITRIRELLEEINNKLGKKSSRKKE